MPASTGDLGKSFMRRLIEKPVGENTKMNEKEIEIALKSLGWTLSNNHMATKNVIHQLEIKIDNQKRPIEILLNTGSSEEIEAALKIVKKLEWKKLYCHGQKDFLLRSTRQAIKTHESADKLQVVGAVFTETKFGFSDTEDPSIQRTKPDMDWER